jgi:ubiquinone/menaquinone biosynthesis C-methylase UbiE
MESTDQKSHWEGIYSSQSTNAVSWYQERPDKSLELIAKSRILKSANIIDVGGGASTLVDNLVARNFLQITVLDISKRALRFARERLGDRGSKVTWLEADILATHLPAQQFDLWHDRAVFHFLTKAEDRKKYFDQLKNALKPGGHVTIATFSLEGPQKCSGLDTVRYDPSALHNEIGPDFELMDTLNEDHHTPFNTVQKFVYCLFRKKLT